MNITVKEPHDLRATLAAMKCARCAETPMRIWERDIKAVEDAIATIDAIRGHSSLTPPSKG